MLKILYAAARAAWHGLRSMVLHILVFLGAIVFFVALVLFVHPGLVNEGERRLYAYLLERKKAAAGLDIDPEVPERVTAVELQELPAEQAAAAYWLGSRYRVAPQPLGALVAEAFAQADKRNMDPALILAVAAIESRFNPYAQSPAGAQGLMQVMTRVHEEKYDNFGGALAAFDPLTNLQVGTLILQDCIARFGSVERGLACYVGAANLPHDGGYSARVLAERNRLEIIMAEPAAALPAGLLPACQDCDD